MQIKVGTKNTGPDLSKIRVWDKRAMAELCAWSVATIVERTTQQGIAADGAPFKPYSTTPIYVSKADQRLTPKGGEDKGASVYYPGGYRQRKHDSRLGGIASAEVDLTLSGQLMREVDAVSVTAEEGVVSVRGQSRTYGTHVNDDRPFLGHHPAEYADMDAEIADAAAGAMRRQTKAAGTPVL